MIMSEREDMRVIDYLYGELPDEDAQAFERAMQDDAELAGEVDEFADVLGAMRTLEDEEPSPHLDALILATAREAVEHETPSPWFQRIFGRPWLNIALGGACAALLAVVVGPTLTMQSAEPDLAPHAATALSKPAPSEPAPPAAVPALEPATVVAESKAAPADDDEEAPEEMALARAPQKSERPARRALAAKLRRAPAPQFGRGITDAFDAPSAPAGGHVGSLGGGRSQTSGRGSGGGAKKDAVARRVASPKPASPPAPRAKRSRRMAQKESLASKGGAPGRYEPQAMEDVLEPPTKQPSSAPPRRGDRSKQKALAPAAAVAKASRVSPPPSASDEEADLGARGPVGDAKSRARNSAPRVADATAPRARAAASGDREQVSREASARQLAREVHKKARELVANKDIDGARALYARARTQTAGTLAYYELTLRLAELEYRSGKFGHAQRLAQQAVRSRDDGVRRAARRLVARSRRVRDVEAAESDSKPAVEVQ